MKPLSYCKPLKNLHKNSISATFYSSKYLLCCRPPNKWQKAAITVCSRPKWNAEIWVIFQCRLFYVYCFLQSFIHRETYFCMVHSLFRIKILQPVFQMPKKFFLITQLFIINVTFKDSKFLIFWSVGQEYSLFMINGCIFHCIQ